MLMQKLDIVTGNLGIVQDKGLFDIMSKGTKFCVTPIVNVKDILD